MHCEIWTAGHSTRTSADFLGLLAAGEIRVLADVRRFPGSRRFPQFNQASLSEDLAREGVEYQHYSALGGRRSARLAGSQNTAWRVEQFNAYADHMQSGEFLDALEQLMKSARQRNTAIMCSEALPQRCHRRLISDALVIRGWQVHHLLTPTRIEEHTLTPFAQVDGMRLLYPSPTLF